MKMRNKGKVYPSPSSSSSSSSSWTSLSSNGANTDALSVLKLLPAVILALVSVLPLEDREVLAYMITKSLKSANPSSIVEEKKKNNKKSNAHKPPIFGCECFDCYTSFWFRWDSSPNRELIHQAIEAFEEHLTSEEHPKKNGRGKKRERMARRGTEKPADVSETPAPEREANSPPPEVEDSFVFVLSGNDAPPMVLPEKAEVTAYNADEEGKEDFTDEEVVAPPEAAAAAAALWSSSANNHKGFARKVLVDVVGLLNSRLWSLWNPNAQ